MEDIGYRLGRFDLINHHAYCGGLVMKYYSTEKINYVNAVELIDVSFAYDSNPVLNHLHLIVPNRQRIGIIGPNGAGKSTLLTLLNGVLRTEDEIKICNYIINRKNKKIIKSLVGLVFQNPDDQLFSPTLLDDVMFGPLNMGIPPQQAKQRSREVLRTIGLEGFEHRSSIHLSFGERKLAAIATVLSMTPEIIALDEPTSNLDALHRRKIIKWLQNQEKTVLITSHDLDMIYETCHRVIILYKGQVVADGQVSDILTNGALLEQYDLERPLAFQQTRHINQNS
ncbi:MAG: ATP-binding cassette domain-containing protein [Caldithrix sp.]|nr:ATP-binding cassette domain-containing protein [Caldithrix sp.]